jgi:hypothetical protein
MSVEPFAHTVDEGLRRIFCHHSRNRGIDRTMPYTTRDLFVDGMSDSMACFLKEHHRYIETIRIDTISRANG